MSTKNRTTIAAAEKKSRTNSRSRGKKIEKGKESKQVVSEAEKPKASKRV